MVEVFVSRLGLDSSTNSFVVILQERDGERILPIWIGRPEAESIAAQLDGVHRERPMTHDLARALITALGGTLHSVRVTRVEAGTFFAQMHLERAGEQIVVDARPSDSIAIALRFDAPILASDDLLAEYEAPAEEAAAEPDRAEGEGGFVPPPSPDIQSAAEQEQREVERLKRHLESLRPEDFGKFTL
ncbi:MAG: bifunctional nuclease family protein [Gemmatimonadetes bacterium]|nr:bifunctional nuclease family protein [Gemmatimonadota bacterium]MBI3568377.1 bifunctional nuclease family protein [Gemmatimonadota bacterium]